MGTISGFCVLFSGTVTSYALIPINNFKLFPPNFYDIAVKIYAKRDARVSEMIFKYIVCLPLIRHKRKAFHKNAIMCGWLAVRREMKF